MLKEKNETGGFIIIIDKENMLIHKYAEISSSEKYSWTNYEYESGIVIDEDVKIKSLEGYELDEVTKKYLDKF